MREANRVFDFNRELADELWGEADQLVDLAQRNA